MQTDYSRRFPTMLHVFYQPTVARKAGNTVDEVLNNPLVQAGAAAATGDPMIGAQMSQAGTVAKSLGSQPSALTNTNNYRGGVNTVSGNILERSQNIGNTAKTMPNFQ